MSQLNIETKVSLTGENPSWTGFARVSISAVLNGELHSETFTSETLSADNAPDLLDYLVSDLERLVNLSDLLDDVNFQGLDDVSDAPSS